MASEEIPLQGGRITPGVVRVGATVRRPVGPHSDFVHSLLRHLEHAGLEGVPRLLGIDQHGREVLSFLPGQVPKTLTERSWTSAQVQAAARLLRGLHDASAGSELAGDDETVCHNDFHPMNTVFVRGLPTAVFDFDQAAPGPRMRDIGYAAWLWLLGAAVEDRFDPQLSLLVIFLDTYGVSAADRVRLGTRMVERVEAERDLHERAGRGGSLSWLHNEIVWLASRACSIDRALGT